MDESGDSTAIGAGRPMDQKKFLDDNIDTNTTDKSNSGTLMPATASPPNILTAKTVKDDTYNSKISYLEQALASTTREPQSDRKQMTNPNSRKSQRDWQDKTEEEKKMTDDSADIKAGDCGGRPAPWGTQVQANGPLLSMEAVPFDANIEPMPSSEQDNNNWKSRGSTAAQPSTTTSTTASTSQPPVVGAIAVEGISPRPDSHDDSIEITCDSTPFQESSPAAPLEPLQATIVGDNNNHEDNTTNNNTNETPTNARVSVKKKWQNPKDPELAEDAIMGTAVNDELEAANKRRIRLVFGLAVLLMLVIIVMMLLGLLGVLSSNMEGSGDAEGSENTEIAASSNLSTLERIKQTGIFHCEYRDFPNANTDLTGYHYSYCLAVAAAIFGPDDAKDKIHFDDYKDRTSLFGPLVDGQVDLYCSGYTHTMERDVFQTQAMLGLSFSTPYLYEGMRIAGDAFFVSHCVEDNFNHLNECQDLRICVGEGTTYHNLLLTLLPVRRIVLVETLGLGTQGFINGDCNVMVTGSFIASSAEEIAATGYNGTYVLSEQYFSKEPLALVTRQDDEEFTAFVGAIVDALKVAEQSNITQSTAHLFPTTEVFGEAYQFMFQHAIEAVGNYREVYERHLSEGVPRAPLNRINDGTTGLLLPHPFGAIGETARDSSSSASTSMIAPPPLGEHLQAILDRGTIRCGISSNRDGFATPTGMEESGFSSPLLFVGLEVDLCSALAASLFQRKPNAVELVELEDPQDGFALLASGEVDVLAGVTRNLPNSVREPSTGIGFALSVPYRYGDDNSNLCLATMQDDYDWSAWVYWIVTALLYAEEHDISKAASNSMPEVFVFGSAHKRMFRDAILEVGNFGDLWDRHLSPLGIPRAGRNTLNLNDNQGPQHYAPPGFVY